MSAKFCSLSIVIIMSLMLNDLLLQHLLLKEKKEKQNERIIAKRCILSFPALFHLFSNWLILFIKYLFKQTDQLTRVYLFSQTTLLLPFHHHHRHFLFLQSIYIKKVKLINFLFFSFSIFSAIWPMSIHGWCQRNWSNSAKTTTFWPTFTHLSRRTLTLKQFAIFWLLRYDHFLSLSLYLFNLFIY